MRKIRDWFAFKGFAVVLSLTVAAIATQAQQPAADRLTGAAAEPASRDAHPTSATQGGHTYVVKPQSKNSTAEFVNGDQQPIGFTGYIKDAESGLYYANARYYDPRVGRFLTQDPAKGSPMQPPSLHRYLYAYANPATYTDSTGRQVDIEDPSVAAMALGWNDEQYADAVQVDIAAREVSSGSFLGASKQVVSGVADFGKWGARLLGKTLFDIGDAKDIVDPVVRVIGATADAIKAGPVGLAEYEAHKSVESHALIEQDRTIEAGEMYGSEVAMAIGGVAASAKLGSLFEGTAGRGTMASIAVEGASGETLLKPADAVLSSDVASAGSTIGNSGSKAAARPAPRQSEIDVGTSLPQGAREQVSFRGGVEVPYGTARSVRPDWCVGSACSVEVKNYNIATNKQGLIRNVSQQAVRRQQELPPGMTQQVVIDIRGQSVDLQQEIAIRRGIAQQSNGAIAPGDITFKRK